MNTYRTCINPDCTSTRMEINHAVWEQTKGRITGDDVWEQDPDAQITYDVYLCESVDSVVLCVSCDMQQPLPAL